MHNAEQHKNEELVKAIGSAQSTPAVPLGAFRWVNSDDPAAGFQIGDLHGTVEKPFPEVFDVTFWVRVDGVDFKARTSLFGRLDAADLKGIASVIRGQYKLRARFAGDNVEEG